MTTHTLIQTFPLSRLFSIKLPKIKINWKIFLFLSFCLALFFSSLYIFQVNEIMRNGYMIKSYQNKIDNLIKENKDLEVNLAQISYLENIQQKTKELNFKETQTIKYIQILDSSLAKK